jgi:hypothetical protein
MQNLTSSGMSANAALELLLPHLTQQRQHQQPSLPPQQQQQQQQSNQSGIEALAQQILSLQGSGQGTSSSSASEALAILQRALGGGQSQGGQHFGGNKF